MIGKSYKNAVKNKCRECIYDPSGGRGGVLQQIAACSSRDCPLFNVRPLPEVEGVIIMVYCGHCKWFKPPPEDKHGVGAGCVGFQCLSVDQNQTIKCYHVCSRSESNCPAFKRR